MMQKDRDMEQQGVKLIPVKQSFLFGEMTALILQSNSKCFAEPMAGRQTRSRGCITFCFYTVGKRIDYLHQAMEPKAGDIANLTEDMRGISKPGELR